LLVVVVLLLLLVDVGVGLLSVLVGLLVCVGCCLMSCTRVWLGLFSVLGVPNPLTTIFRKKDF
jgi:hypothetical protein